MKTVLRFSLFALVLSVVGCTTTVTKEYSEETKKVISQEPVIGGAPPATTGR